MNAPTKLAAFGVVLLIAFGAAYGVGTAVGPLGDASTPAPPAHHPDAPGHDGGG